MIHKIFRFSSSHQWLEQSPKSILAASLPFTTYGHFSIPRELYQSNPGSPEADGLVNSAVKATSKTLIFQIIFRLPPRWKKQIGPRCGKERYSQAISRVGSYEVHKIINAEDTMPFLTISAKKIEIFQFTFKYKSLYPCSFQSIIYLFQVLQKYGF